MEVRNVPKGRPRIEETMRLAAIGGTSTAIKCGLELEESGGR